MKYFFIVFLFALSSLTTIFGQTKIIYLESGSRVVDTVTAWLENGLYYIEDDIVVGTAKDFHNKSAGIISIDKLWPYSTVPYVIGPGFSQDQSRQIIKAINEINNVTNLCWIVRSNEANFVELTNDNTGCWSLGTGMQGGRQRLNLSDGCFNAGNNEIGIILHEMGHVLGLHHEQKKPNRDHYVTINLENIVDSDNPPNGVFDEIYQFNILPYDLTGNSTELSYDYGSIMHYGPNSFGNNTISINTPPGNSSTVIGQRDAFSENDLQGIDKMYPVTCSGCNRIYDASTGSFNDGSSSSSNYPNNRVCSYLIQPESSSQGQADKIRIEFSRFNTEQTYDFVYVFDGPNPNFPLIGKYDGTTLPPVITSKSGSVFIQFETDGSQVRTGWNLSYRGIYESRLPDLSFHYSGKSTRWWNFDILRVNLTIINYGVNPAFDRISINRFQDFKLGFYLSNDKALSSNDYEIGTEEYRFIDGESMVNGFLNLDLSCYDIPEGEYYLFAKIDADNQIQERSESNNNIFWSKAITLTSCPTITTEILCNEIERIDVEVISDIYSSARREISAATKVRNDALLNIDAPNIFLEESFEVRTGSILEIYNDGCN